MRSTGIPIKDIIHIAIKSMGLDYLAPFNPNEKIIEYRIGKHSKDESLYLRNAMNSLDVCIKSKRNCGRTKKKS